MASLLDRMLAACGLRRSPRPLKQNGMLFPADFVDKFAEWGLPPHITSLHIRMSGNYKPVTVTCSYYPVKEKGISMIEAMKTYELRERKSGSPPSFRLS